MLDRKDNPEGAEKRPESGTGTLKAFNRTGREDTTTEVLRPQRDPNALRRNGALIAVVAVAIGFLLFMAFQRSHLSLFADPSQSEGRTFGPGEHPVDRSE